MYSFIDNFCIASNMYYYQTFSCNIVLQTINVIFLCLLEYSFPIFMMQYGNKTELLAFKWKEKSILICNLDSKYASQQLYVSAGQCHRVLIPTLVRLNFRFSMLLPKLIMFSMINMLQLLLSIWCTIITSLKCHLSDE